MRVSNKRSFLVLLLLGGLLLLSGCSFEVVRRLRPPERVLEVDRASFLKVHLRNGELAVLDDWTVETPMGSVSRHTTRRPAALASPFARIDPTVARLSGRGVLYSAARDEVARGGLAFPMDSVVLLESDHDVGSMHPVLKALLIVIGVAVAAVAITCAIDPKACFGSCPTFYVDDGHEPSLQAEGFSSSVTPALEATDVDALYRAHPQGRDVRVTMRNEALETHVVRFVRLLAAPREPGERVLATRSGVLWRARDLRGPVTAVAAEGNVEPALRQFDGAERFSLADSTDLAAHETLELTFDPSGSGSHGVMIAARQTLVTTFLFYQTLAHMGRAAGSWIAELERRSDSGQSADFPVGRLLGGIEVQVRDARGRWTTVGTAGETGPLATDVQLVPLPAGTDAHRIRLRMARGLWRIDQVALAALDGPVQPLRLDPTEVTRDGVSDDQALAALRGPNVSPTGSDAGSGEPDDALVTIRGDRYELRFRLPEDANHYELFLESRGYYLEWMRKEWQPDESFSLAARTFRDPAASLRALAPEYKRREASMEALFWGSRYARP
jgi:hypothetical protein